MNKDAIKTLCESDPRLQWWAMVLFAEISEMVDYQQGRFDAAVMKVIATKVDEFPRLVVQESLNKAKGELTYDQRLGAVEKAIKKLTGKGAKDD